MIFTLVLALTKIASSTSFGVLESTSGKALTASPL